MSKVGITLSIDVSKIDKSKLFTGKKGTYLDAQVFIDLGDADQYGKNGMITQAVSKDERQQGVKGAILGNCKVFWRDGDMQQVPQTKITNARPSGQSYQEQPEAAVDFDDSIPF